jgi:hypothetical protein
MEQFRGLVVQSAHGPLREEEIKLDCISPLRPLVAQVM